jgi:enamine deaminase RidA (YjgF/YER057c/UK114 family)
MVYTSGSVGMSKDGKMVEGSVQDRTRQVITVSMSVSVNKLASRAEK